MHFAQKRASQKTGDSRDIENSTVAYGSSCDCVYCIPSAYELNRPLACKRKYVWNDIISHIIEKAVRDEGCQNGCGGCLWMQSNTCWSGGSN